MKKELSKTAYFKEITVEKTNGKKKKITINLDKYPKLYNKLVELSHTNVRTIEQQALFYVMQAVGETEVDVRKNDKYEQIKYYREKSEGGEN